MPVCTEDGSCWTTLEVKLAMCPAIKAPEDARAEEGPEATLGKIGWSLKGHERRMERGRMEGAKEGRISGDDSVDVESRRLDGR